MENNQQITRSFLFTSNKYTMYFKILNTWKFFNTQNIKNKYTKIYQKIQSTELNETIKLQYTMKHTNQSFQ